ncbi:MAG: hypothetical protein JXX14_01890 [Deltaproteobacteria bacterium]|nr:hypothetical protein [Deltaproteobacteria bacterium]
MSCICVMWMVTACVVTDEIEFYDKVNMPPQRDSIVPTNDKIDTITNNSEKKYTVYLWDPDEYDGSDYRGKINVIAQTNAGPVKLWADGPCESPDPSEPDPDKYDGGIMVRIDCNAVFQMRNAPEKTTVIIQVTISDRQFSISSADEAKTLQVTWTGELYPGNEK